MEEKLKSEQVVLAAPMSFHGSAARIWKVTDTKNKIQKYLLACFALTAVFFAWCVVLVWYVFFGLWLVPYRLVRRGQRKRKMENLRHRELLNTIDKKA